MTIKKAVAIDLESIYFNTKSCAEQLINQGVFQWNEAYPSKEIIQKDIELKQLWKLAINDKVIGSIVLTEIEDADYKDVNWLTENSQNLYIHRLAIHPNFQGEGYAQKLMDFAENYASKNNYNSIRLDTFSQNKRNQIFYKKRNYIQLDAIFLPNQSTYPFYCFEKVLNV